MIKTQKYKLILKSSKDKNIHLDKNNKNYKDGNKINS